MTEKRKRGRPKGSKNKKKRTIKKPKTKKIKTADTIEVSKIKKPKTFCIAIDMGVGDTIIATAAIRNIKKAYPDSKVYVAAVYDFVFNHNPHIDQVYHLGHPSVAEFYQHTSECDFDSCINLKFYEKMYHTKYNGPMSKAACEILGVPFDEDRLELYLSDDELEFAEDILESFNKPVILLHGYGSNVQGQGKQMITAKDWFPEYWDKLIELGKHKYDFIQIGGKGEPVMKGAFNLAGQITYRQSFALIQKCTSFVGIDSFSQHAANALGKTGAVLFGRSNPEILGHETNMNLIVKQSCPDIMCGRPHGGFGDMIVKEDGWMTHWDCPHRTCMKALVPEIVYQYLNNMVIQITKKIKNY